MNRLLRLQLILEGLFLLVYISYGLPTNLIEQERKSTWKRTLPGLTSNSDRHVHEKRAGSSQFQLSREFENFIIKGGKMSQEELDEARSHVEARFNPMRRPTISENRPLGYPSQSETDSEATKPSRPKTIREKLLAFFRRIFNRRRRASTWTSVGPNTAPASKPWYSVGAASMAVQTGIFVTWIGCLIWKLVPIPF